MEFSIRNRSDYLYIFYNPFVELKKRIFYLPDWTMISKVDILHERHATILSAIRVNSLVSIRFRKRL